MQYSYLSLKLIMNSASNRFREWKVLCWNVRGLNSDTKWNSLRYRITESACDIICLQETKTDSFDLSFIKNFCPPSFDSFLFVPSVGASEGIITIWKSALLDGVLAFQSDFALSVNFTSKFNDEDWLLTNVYGPSTHEGKRDFVN